MKAHDAVVIASPEYNGLPTPLLKNVIDWVTRIDISVFHGKKYGLISATPGALGGIRGLSHLRILLSNIGAIVMPSQAAIGNFSKVVNEHNEVTDAKVTSMLESVIDGVM